MNSFVGNLVFPLSLELKSLVSLTELVTPINISMHTITEFCHS